MAKATINDNISSLAAIITLTDKSAKVAFKYKNKKNYYTSDRILSIPINQDNKLDFTQAKQDLFSETKMQTKQTIYISRALLSLYKKELYYTEIKKYFEENEEASSALMFYSQHYDTIAKDVKYTIDIVPNTSKHPLTKSISQYEISFKKSNDISAFEYRSSSRSKTYSIQEIKDKSDFLEKSLSHAPSNLFLPTSKSTLMQQKLLSYFKKEIFAKYLQNTLYQERYGLLHSLLMKIVKVAKPEINEKLQTRTVEESELQLEILKDIIFETNKITSFSAIMQKSLIQKTIENLSADIEDEQAILEVIKIIQEIYANKNLKEIQQNMQSIYMKFKDKTFFHIFEHFFSNTIKILDQVNTQNLADIKQYSYFSEAILDTLPENILIATFFTGEADTADEGEKMLSKLPVGSLYSLSVPSKEYMSLLSGEETEHFLNIASSLAIDDQDNEQVFLVGIKTQPTNANEKTLLYAPDKINLNSNNDIEEYMANKIKKAYLVDFEQIVNKASVYKKIKNTSLMDFFKSEKEFLQSKTKQLSYLSSASGKNMLLLSYSNGNVGMTDKVFDNPYIINNELVGKLSVADIINDSFIRSILSLKTEEWKTFLTIAKKMEVSVPKTKMFFIKPSSGTTNISEADKFETIAYNKHLGMLKYGLLPSLDITEKKDKEVFFNIITTKFNEIKDKEEFQNLIEQASFVVPLAKKEILDQGTIVTRPKICLLSDIGKVVTILSIDIYKYVDLLEESKIVDFQDLTKMPTIKTATAYRLVKNLVESFHKTYRSILSKDDLFEVQKIYQELKSLTGGKRLSFADIEQKVLADKVKKISSLLYQPLAQQKLISINTKQFEKDINSFPISQYDKRFLKAMIMSSDIVYNKSKVDIIATEFEKKNPSIKKALSDFVAKIHKNIDDNIEQVRVEAYTLLYYYNMYADLYYAHKTSDKKLQEQYIMKAYRQIASWGENALGLFKEQVQVALNIVLHKSQHKQASYRIFHAMGTGKTRLGLFYMFLQSTFSGKPMSFYAQSKNIEDIEGQMAQTYPPTIREKISIIAGSGVSQSQEITPIPFSLIDGTYPNIFGGDLSNIYIAHSTENIQKELSRTYAKEIQQNIEWANSNDFLSFAKKNFPVAIYQILNQVSVDYAEIVNKELFKLNPPFSKKEINPYYLKQEKLTFAVLSYLLKQSDQGSILLNEKGIELIKKKISQNNITFFNGLVSYLKFHKNKDLSLIAQSVFSSFPKEISELSIQKITKNYSDQKMNKITVLQSSFDVDFKYRLLTHAQLKDFLKYKGNDIFDLFYNSYLPKKITTDEVWLFVNDPFYIASEIREAIEYFLLDNTSIDELDNSDIKDITKLFAAKITFSSVKNTLCPSIKDDNMPVEVRTVLAKEIYPKDFEQFKKAVDDFLVSNYKSDTAQKIAKRALSLIHKKDGKAIAKILNHYFFAQAMSDFYNPSLTYKNRLKRFSQEIPSSSINLSFHVKIHPLVKNTKNKDSILLPVGFGQCGKNTETDTYYVCYSGSIAQTFVNPLKTQEIAATGDMMEMNYKNGNFTNIIDFSSIGNIAKKIKTDVLLNTSHFFIPKKNIISQGDLIDEAHKNLDRVPTFLNKATRLTGTPTNGMPQDLPKAIENKGDKDKIKAEALQIATNAGVVSIQSPFVVSILAKEEILVSIVKLAAAFALDKSNTLSLADKISQMQEVLQAEVENLETRLNEIADKAKKTGVHQVKYDLIASKKLYKNFIKASTDDIVAFTQKVADKLEINIATKILKEDTSAETQHFYNKVVYSAIPKNILKTYPGFENPSLIGSYLKNKATDSEQPVQSSINPGDDRTYNFEDGEQILRGLFPMLSSEQLNFKLQTHLEYIYILHSVFKAFNLTKAYQNATAVFSIVINNILFNKDKKVQNYVYEQIKNILGEETLNSYSIKNYKTLIRHITPKSTQDNDSLQNIFNNKIPNYAHSLWDEADIVKKTVIRFFANTVNLFLTPKKLQEKIKYIQDILQLPNKVEVFEQVQEVFDEDFCDVVYEHFETSGINASNILQDPAVIDVESMRGYKLIMPYENQTTIYKIPFIGLYEVDLKYHFPDVFLKELNEPIPLQLKALGGKNNEIFADILNDNVDSIINNLKKDLNTFLVTTRTALTQFKITELCHYILTKDIHFEKPLYIVCNATSPLVSLTLRAIDKAKLASNNVLLIATEPNKLHRDYNAVPKNANLVIVSNDASAAEGFRFPRINKIITAGQPNKTNTALQVYSRPFFPGKTNVSNITLAGKKNGTLIYGKQSAQILKENPFLLNGENIDTRAQNYPALLSKMKVKSIVNTSENVGCDAKAAYNIYLRYTAMTAALKFMSANTSQEAQEKITKILAPDGNTYKESSSLALDLKRILASQKNRSDKEAKRQAMCKSS